MNDLTGTTLGQYEIVKKIGQGGMAHVFKAYQPTLDRFVAIKVLSPTLAEEPGFTERFHREAQAVARLHHPNILQVFDFGIQDKYSYIVMRYVENSTTLDDLIHTGTPLERLVDYIIQVADALNYAHEQDIVHRDVKPSNILIDGKWALLSDFGLVKMGQSSSHLTQTGTGLGTPAYMAPEQASGLKVDRRADIYALGIILHRILTGTVPHDAPTPFAILVKRSTEPVPPLRQIKPDIPESVEQVVLRSLSKEPDARYSTATDFAEALKKAKSDPGYREPTLANLRDTTMASTPKTPPSTPSLPIPATSPKKLGLLAGGVIAIVITATLLLGGLWLWFRSDKLIAATDLPVRNKPTVSIAIDAPKTSAPPVDTPTPLAPTPTPTSVPPSLPVIIAKTELEVRSGPGEIYDLVGYLPVGAKSDIMGRDKAGQWWQIKTGLTATGAGWIKADPTLVEATGADNVAIALAPPTPTGTATSSPTATPTIATSTATPRPATATPSATSTQSPPTLTPTSPPSKALPVAKPTQPPPAPAGQFTLLKPVSLEQPSFGPTEFEWQWNGQLQEGQGFEVRVWREGEPPSGVHNAVEDNQKGNIMAVGNNTYHLSVNIKEAYGVKGRSGEYWWTVVVIQFQPEYKDLGIQAPPARLRFEAGGGGGGGGKGGGGGGGGGVDF
ncbi:MAG: protein kinase [Anaerolineae bacterium]